MATGVGIDPARIAQLTEREEAHLNSETSGSARMYARSRAVMPNGVPSSYQARSPHPIFLERGVGSKVWDVDGSEYRDFHNGFGTMVQGHAHPLITKAVVERMPMGTHFAAATEDSVIVAEELKRRWGLPKWRFTNSGSESTMDAIRLARAHTGRELVIKMEGSYHGHHDTVMVSIGIDIDDDAVLGHRGEMGALRHALGDGARDRGVGVSLHHRAEAVVEIAVLRAVDVPDLRADAALEEDRVRAACLIRGRHAHRHDLARALVHLRRAVRLGVQVPLFALGQLSDACWIDTDAGCHGGAPP